MARILIVDDEKKMCDILVDGLKDDGHDVDGSYSAPEALGKVAAAGYDIVVTDLRMPEIDGLEFLRSVKDVRPETEVVMITAHATADTAVAAMKEGAFDYIIKPFSIDEISDIINNILRKKARSEDPVREDKKPAGPFDNIVGRSPAMVNVFKQAGQVAREDVTVLIRGESGTGKELVAHAIHMAGPRAGKPFITVNCTALPETLFENELFGHDRGAFTGATKGKAGKIESADGGTLFLDEIGDLGISSQGKLLRALEQKSFHRVGGTELVNVDVRIVAATNADLEKAVAEKRFRQDLYYRLHVFTLTIPPLRERGDDVMVLAEHFLKRSSSLPVAFEEEALQKLCSYSWPGNVRELENAVVSAALKCTGSAIRLSDLPREIASGTPGPSGTLRLDEMERRLIEEALSRTGGNKAEAARLLGITRRSLYSRLERLLSS